jgi:hypothetical protein
VPGVERSLTVLNVRLALDCDVPALIEPFLGVFSAFLDRPGGSADGDPVRIRIDGAAGRYDDGSRQVPLVEGRLRTTHVYNLLYTSLVRSLAKVYLLHAAVVARAGRAWVVSGPAGSGKTSLGRALVERGFAFMSDDLAPLAVGDGCIHPFPRRIGLERAAGGWAGSAGATPDAAVAVGDKAFVAPEQLGASPVERPLPPGAVVIMNPYPEGEGAPARLRVGLLAGADDFCRRLEAVPGVEMRRARPAPEVEIVEATLRGAAAVAAVQRELERADQQVLFHSRGYGQRKVYAARPALRPLPVREAAVALLRETLNREPGSALMARHGGQAGAALFELIDLIGEVPCYRLTPAGVEATADLLEETFR